MGLLLGRCLPPIVPRYLGHFLYWIGVPFSVLVFLRGTDLNGGVWLAPVVAWVAILGGAALAWIWILGDRHRSSSSISPSSVSPSATSPSISPSSVSPSSWSRPSQGSFLLAAMLGNTGYLGYPISLTLVGPKYFVWALFYDLMGSTLGAYALGVVLAAYFGRGSLNLQQLTQAIVINPTLWCFGLGLYLKTIALPPALEQTLQSLAWGTMALALTLIGMRLSQLSSWQHLNRVAVVLAIKMVLVPILLGLGLIVFDVHSQPQLALVLQTAMPPAFATLVIAEAYNLDRELSVTALALGTLGLVVMLPLWLWLFGT